ncbi:MAG: sugar porter family MFS transporter [Acidobacteriota bacterium]|nr:sugar porter family MFS transporter [Acidobacteriota bacterium]
MFRRPGVLAAGICSLGGLVFGYDLGALSTVAPSLRVAFHLSPMLFGITVAASLWGTVCGSILAGRIVDRIGRQALIGSCAALYLLAVGALVLPESAGSWGVLVGMRCLCGAAIGGLTVGCPLYLAEIAPRSSRGFFVGSFQLQVGLGVLLAFVSGTLSMRFTGGSMYWRVCLGVGILPAALLLLLLRCMTPVPYWLESRDGCEDAQVAAENLGFLDPESKCEQATPLRDRQTSHEERLFSRKYRRTLLLATSIALFNQLSGVNIILFYLLDLLSSAGLTVVLSHQYTIFISGLNLGTTLLSMGCVDRFGRKPLLLVGSLGMALCLLSLGVAIPYHANPIWYLIILVAYNGFFAFSQGTIVWIYLSELFPFGVRGAGQGYGAAVHWIANALLVLVFPLLQRSEPMKSFYFFALMMVVQIGVILLWYPETKGIALGASDQVT